MYQDNCEELAEQLYNTLLINMDSILRFLRLRKLKNEVDVILYSTIEDYIAHINKCKHSYYEWMIDDFQFEAYEADINILKIYSL